MLNCNSSSDCKINMEAFFHFKDNTLDVQDGSCNVIEIASYGLALMTVHQKYMEHHRLFDNWLGRYYNVGWQNNKSEDKYVYRRIGKLLKGDIRYREEELYYHVGFSYSKLLGYWRVWI